MIRLVKGGPEVPARLLMHAEIEGRQCGEPNAEPFRSDGVSRVWHGGRRISEEEYNSAMARKRPPATKRVDPRHLEIEF